MKFYQSFLFYIAVAMLVLAPFSGYAIIVLIPSALIIILADVLLRRFVKNRRRLVVFQLLTLVVLFSYPLWPRWDGSVSLKVNLPPNFVGHVMIVMGVEGAPPLESNTATISIPPNGLFLSSTRVGKEDKLVTNLDQQHLAYFESIGSSYNCGRYKIVDYHVSNVDSIQSMPLTLVKSRAQEFYDSLRMDPNCDEGVFW